MLAKDFSVLEACLRSNIALASLLPTAIAQNPLSPDELLGMGSVDRRLGSNTPSLPEEQLPFLSGNRLRGTFLVLTGQPDAAAIALEDVPERDFLGHFMLAFAYGMQGREDKVRQTLADVPGVEAYLALAGLAKQKAGDYNAAVQFLEMAAVLDRGANMDRALIYETLSKDYYTHLSDKDAAFYWAQRWVDYALTDFNSTAWLAALYLWNGRPEDAYAAWRRVEPLGGGKHRYYPGHMGQVFELRGDLDTAVQFYRESWARNSNDPWVSADVAWYLGNALYHQGNYEEARGYLEFVLRNGRENLREVAQRLLAEMGKP
jgi:tetratricopeptide (TPR) repeat protein